MDFQELNSDQRREAVNTQQRYSALREARARCKGYRGSMIWQEIKGHQYLLRSFYDKNGIRRQTSLGARSAETEKIHAEHERGRIDAESRLKELETVNVRQAAINRAVGLRRVPLLGAKIIRALDDAGLLGSGIRVLGTTAIYAYEAVAGVRIESALTTTEDIDLLLARASPTFGATEDVPQPSLLNILRKVDRSFEKTKQTFRAQNREGYLVDLIKPMRDPPWKKDAAGNNPSDLEAAEIEGLDWHESAPAFEAIAIDDKGDPLRIVASDPRVWAAHKLWLSKRPDREPIRRRRDEAQARAIGSLVARYLSHLEFNSKELRMLPKNIVEDAAPLFE